MAKFGRRHRRRIDKSDPWVRFRIGVGLLLLVLFVGTIGYMALGLGLLDAVYQTVITVSTVGYRELGEFDREYEMFTIFLILFGTGTALYTLGMLLETLFEGQLDDQFRRRRMQKRIEKVDGHVIVCGYGQVGRSIVDEMRRAGRRVVVVDREDHHLDDVEGLLGVVGEATDDQVLADAGIERAETLVVALDSDADNLFVALTARSQNERLFIVARANSAGVVDKFERVGVDRVVNPHEIGGSRMAAMVLQPGVTDFLDVVMHDKELEVRMAEIEVAAGSAYAGATVTSILTPDHPSTTLVAVRRAGRFITNPPGDLAVEVGDVLIALGTDDHLAAMITAAH
ncbi:MAG: potassium channel protein [Actinomycetota bacterium]